MKYHIIKVEQQLQLTAAEPTTGPLTGPSQMSKEECIKNLVKTGTGSNYWYES